MSEIKRAELATSTLKHRLIVDIGGEHSGEKQGKTHFALTAPAPIAYFNVDDRSEGVIDKFCDEKKIYRYDYHDMPRENKEHYEMRWEKFLKDFDEAVSSDEIRTIVWDTESEIWEMRRLAAFGRAASIPTAFVPLNKDMRGFFNRVNETDKNFITITRAKKKYVGKLVPTRDGVKEVSTWDGSYELSGWSEVPGKVQVNTRIHYDMGESEFVLRVLNCGLDMGLSGTELRGDMCCFPYLAYSVFPDTDITDWGGEW